MYEIYDIHTFKAGLIGLNIKYGIKIVEDFLIQQYAFDATFIPIDGGKYIYFVHDKPFRKNPNKFKKVIDGLVEDQILVRVIICYPKDFPDIYQFSALSDSTTEIKLGFAICPSSKKLACFVCREPEFEEVQNFINSQGVYKVLNSSSKGDWKKILNSC